ncbi:hypothetical protein T03_7227 [Trichinella britovi]|uniref:Uncharacterized protein n=1 Tax=Trichinella britovi TaxID=45882 RepID=A0A0V1CJ26_TRIBR|nr:hypothetical protein T03_7227 [Trichinella britovi]
MGVSGVNCVFKFSTTIFVHKSCLQPTGQKAAVSKLFTEQNVRQLAEYEVPSQNFETESQGCELDFSKHSSSLVGYINSPFNVSKIILENNSRLMASLLILAVLLPAVAFCDFDKNRQYFIRLCQSDSNVRATYEELHALEDFSAVSDETMDALVKHGTALYMCKDRKQMEKLNHMPRVAGGGQKTFRSMSFVSPSTRAEMVRQCVNEPLLRVLFEAMRASDKPNIPYDERLRAIFTWTSALDICMQQKEEIFPN